MAESERTPARPTGPFVSGLRCLRCGRRYPPDAPEFTCSCRPNQGSDVGTLDVQYDYDAIRRTVDPAAIQVRSGPFYGPLLSAAAHRPP